MWRLRTGQGRDEKNAITGTVRQLHGKVQRSKGEGAQRCAWQAEQALAKAQEQSMPPAAGDTEHTVQQPRAAARGEGAAAMLHPANKQLPKLQQYCSACGQAVAIKRRTARHAP